jgi:hypothetical protein
VREQENAYLDMRKHEGSRVIEFKQEYGVSDCDGGN